MDTRRPSNGTHRRGSGAPFGQHRARDEQIDWLRGYAREFWRHEAPERWAELHPLVQGGIPGLPAIEHWDLKFDLTLRDADGPRSALTFSAKAVDKLVWRWAQQLAQDADDHLLLAYTIARTDLEGRPHVHGVTSAPPLVAMDAEHALRTWTASSRWAGPHSVVQRYDADLGAIAYALDHGGLPIPHVACPRPRRPRCKKKKCIGARFPWRPYDAVMEKGRAATRRDAKNC